MESKESNKKIKLWVLDGHDCTGKDEIMNHLSFDNYLVYKQPTMEDQNVDYKDKEAFKNFMLRHIRKVLDDLYTMSKLNGTDRPIVMSRLLVCDNVFSDLYDREHIVEKYFGKEIETNFDVTNYIMLFAEYSEYCKRVRMVEGTIDFTPEEFDNIVSLYNIHKSPTDKIKLIYANDTKEKELSDFIVASYKDTPSYKRENSLYEV